MKVLALDSSAITASVALNNDGKTVGEFFINTNLTHSSTLMPMVDALLKNTHTDINEVDVFTVCSGPGSFTGIRIGVATVKGLATALNKPCIAVSTLECMAYNMLNQNVIVCSVMDARCNQVYNALFRINGENVERLCDDRALSLVDLISELTYLKSKGENIVIVGDGADITNVEAVKSGLNIHHTVPEILKYQRASSLAICALKRAEKNELLTAEQLMPRYLRLPQAQRELNKKLNKTTEANV